jgi:hypothetical protein
MLVRVSFCKTLPDILKKLTIMLIFQSSNFYFRFNERVFVLAFIISANIFMAVKEGH